MTAIAVQILSRNQKKSVNKWLILLMLIEILYTRQAINNSLWDSEISCTD